MNATTQPSGHKLTYTYDVVGNLTSKEGITQTYGGTVRGPHALATSGGVTYNYDANGNLSWTSDGTNITWNAENMPDTVMQSGIRMYDKFFQGESLWKKVEPAGTTYYLPSMRVENGQFRKFFGGFAERLTNGQPSAVGTLSFYHNDRLGSASLVTNAQGQMSYLQAYMPYGGDRALANPGNFTAR